MTKGSFILYDSDLKALELLTKSQVGTLFKALAGYRLRGEEPDFGKNVAVDIIFRQIVTHIEINEEKYRATCEKKSEAMKKRWSRDEKSKPIVKDSTLYYSAEEGLLLGDNDNVNENENENENDNDTENDTDACGAKRENKRKNYHSKNTPRLLRDEPSYDLDAFTRSAIGLKYKKKEPLKEEKDNPCGLS